MFNVIVAVWVFEAEQLVSAVETPAHEAVNVPVSYTHLTLPTSVTV